MRYFRIVTALLILLCGPSEWMNAKTEPLGFIFEHYSSDDGLPHNSICDIHQDSRGYLWLCTWYGLSRYDGNGFVNYTMMPGDYSDLSHNRILSVQEDVNGHLWFMTYDYHLYRFDVDEESFTAVPAGLEDFPVNNAKVDHVTCDSHGNVWVALAGAGLFRVSEDLSYDLYFNVTENNPGKEVSSVYEDSEGTIYVSTENGISMIKEGDVSLLARNTDVVDFVEKDGCLYFACPDQLLAVDMDTRGQKRTDLRKLNLGYLTSMTLTGPKEHLYLGFQDGAVAYVDTESMEMKVSRTDMGRVRYLFPDPEGLLWIATERTGIWSYDESGSRFKHYEHTNNVMSYYVDTLAMVKESDGRLWIKMNNYGFGYYDRASDEIVPLNNVKEHEDNRFMNGVACYEIDGSGVLWMSTVG